MGTVIDNANVHFLAIFVSNSKSKYLKSLLFLFSLFICLIGKGQLKADFNADVRQGCAPVLVQFTDNSTGNPTSYLWDFGNGSAPVSVKNPSTIYFNPGTYNVKLVIRGASGADSITKNQFITVNAQPTVDFTVSDTGGCSPLNVQFTDKSVANTGTISSYAWDFGDGTTSTSPSPLHTYSINGDFTINLKVTNSTGCSKILTRVNNIHVTQKPKADFTSSSSSSNCTVPIKVSFTNTSSGDGIRSYLWDFGDGTTANTQNSDHDYTRAGVFNVKLLIVNQFGCSDTITKSVSIGSEKANFTGPDNVCEGSAASFVNTSTPAVFASSWTFGDGTASSQANPTKTFNTAGTYTVKLVNDFGACKDSISRSITVLPKPSAEFSFSPTTFGCVVPATVNFTAASATEAKYQWKINSVDFSTEMNPVNVFNNRGNYSISLTTTGTNGCTNTVTKNNAVAIQPVRINGLDSVPYSGCFPRIQNFGARITTPDPIASYLWTFGDGTTSTDAKPSHTYTDSGAYNVSLKVFTTSGCSDSITVRNAVVLNSRPVAKFSALPLTSCASEQVQFTDESTGTISKWLWEFGDGGTSNKKDPLYHYFDTGYFSVKLSVSNNNCTDTVSYKNYIFISPPIAKFDLKFECNQPMIRTFQSRSIDAKTFAWDFGDGTTSADSMQVHTYNSPGQYIVKLRVDNGTCFDEFKDTIDVIDERPNFTVDNNVNCRNSNILFTATNINAKNISRYVWNFGDSRTNFTSNVPTISHVYDSIGLFSPSLVITDILGCTRTVSNILSVNIYGPKPAFTSPPGTCVNNNVTFTDQSEPYPEHPIVSWKINYGDGTFDSSATAPSFNHTYTVAKSYTVTLTVLDNFGCKDSVRRTINITDPVADFSVNDSISCSNSSVNFINNSNGVSLNYNWDFGDNSTSTALNAIHSYVAEGAYDVSLKVTDVYGCTDSIRKPAGILVKNAKADFDMSNTVIICPPAQISFSSKAEAYTSLVWDFDDGNNSNVDSPFHYFENAGTYNVKLTARGHGSCVDSIVKQLTVLGPRGSFTYQGGIVCAPASVTFTGNAINNDNFIWDFQDGNTLTTNASTVSHTYSTIGKYLPKLLLRDTALNCTVTITGKDTLYIAGVTSAVKNLANLFCDTAGVQFQDSSIAQFDVINSYLWNFGDGTTSTSPNPYHSYLSTGTYPVKLSVTTSAGCVDSSGSASVNVIKGPRLQITGNTPTCVNQAITFGATLVEPYGTDLTWSWNFKNGNTSNLQNPGAQTYGSAGTYIVSSMVTSTNGCFNKDSVSLLIKPLPVVNAGLDSIICLGQSISLIPTGASTYVWQNNTGLSCTNCTSPVISPVASTNYIVTGTSAEACQNIDTILVTVIQPTNISVMPGDTVCVGESAKLLATGADNYTWTPSTGLNNANIANPLANPTATTVYTAIGRDYRNCFSDTATVPVIVYPIPVFNIVQENVSIPVGNSVQINTTNSPDITSWRWLPAGGLSCANCPQPVATPLGTVTYTAIASNTGGCTARDQVTIQTTCNNGNVYVPNTFSPNNDGTNDVFFPRGKGIGSIKTLQIFNRWGVLVFQKMNFSANDQSAGWDGTYQGQKLDSDVFIYKMEVVCSNNEIFLLNGNITLIK